MIFPFLFSLAQVSWIRKRDLHILTTGSSSYTSDQRFQVQMNDWQIEFIVVSFFSVSHFHPLIGFEKDLSFFCAFRSSSSLSNLVSWMLLYYLLQVIRSHDLGNWTLQIKYPHLRDNGVYECQINTEPKMSLSYVLNVVGKTRDRRTCCVNCHENASS